MSSFRSNDDKFYSVLALRSDRTTRLAVLSYGTFSFVFIAFEEIYPLWCATERYHGENCNS